MSFFSTYFCRSNISTVTSSWYFLQYFLTFASVDMLLKIRFFSDPLSTCRHPTDVFYAISLKREHLHTIVWCYETQKTVNIRIYLKCPFLFQGKKPVNVTLIKAVDCKHQHYSLLGFLNFTNWLVWKITCQKSTKAVIVFTIARTQYLA